MGLFDRLKKSKNEEKNDELHLTNSLETKILFNKATECLQEQKNEEAIKLFDELLRIEPENIHALNGKGSGLMQSGRLDEADEVFNQSLNIQDNEMAFFNKALICGHKEDYENAIIFCDKAIEANPGLKEVGTGVKNDFIKKMNEKNSMDSSEFNIEAQELINKANKLRDTEEIWKGDKLHEELQSGMPEFKKITVWDAWDLYEDAIKKDSRCENLVTGYINELKADLIQEFLFFDISKNDDFDPSRDIDSLKLSIMKNIYLDKNFTQALIATNQILSINDPEDIDALNFKGALSFYYDELDEAIELFEKVSDKGNGIYTFFGDFNKAFVLRRKTMVTHDAEYMIQAMDIYDEMLKDPQCFGKVKPYQREILDKLQEFMNVPLL